MEDIKNNILTILDKLEQLRRAVLKEPNAVVMQLPVRLNERTTKAHVKFTPALNGYEWGDLLSNDPNLNLADLQVGDEVLFNGNITSREYNGKTYLSVWCKSCVAVSHTPIPVRNSKGKPSPVKVVDEVEDDIMF